MIALNAGAPREDCHARNRASWLTGASIACLTAIPLGLVSGGSAWGFDLRWTGGEGEWGDKSRWERTPGGFAGQLPGAADTVFIYGAGPGADDPGLVAGRLIIDLNGTLSVQRGFEGGTLNVSSASIGFSPRSTGTVTETGRETEWNVGNLNLGEHGSTGKLIVSSGGKVISRSTSMEGYDSSISIRDGSSEWSNAQDVVISSGRLIVTGGGAARIGGTLELRNGTIIIGSGSTDPRDAVAPGLISAAEIRVDAGSNLNFNYDNGGSQYEFAPVLSGTGSLNLYNGSTVLTGRSLGFAGPTNVHERAVLTVKGSLSSSDVTVWGVLAGHGEVKSATVKPGGRIEPGNSVGTLRINGNFSMDAGSVYRAEINGTTSDLIEVGGTANILSRTIEIVRDKDSTSPILPGTRYTLITAAGGLTGGTPKHAIADFPFLNLTLSSDANNAYLTLSRNSGAFAELASTRNEKALANALDAAGAASPLWQQVVGAGEAQARAAFTSLGSAAIHANAAGVLSAQSRYLRDAVIDRARQGFTLGAALAPGSSVMSFAPGTSSTAYASDTASPFHKAPLPMLAAAPAFAMWAQGLGSWGSLKGDRNAPRTDHTLGGIISGLDVTFDGMWRVGLAGGYTRSSFDTPGLAASGSSDSYHVALYGGGQIGAWGLRAGASYSWNGLTTSRRVVAVNLASLERGDNSPKTTQLFGEVGHSFAFAGGALEPFANLAYVRVDGDISERGVAATTGSMQLDTTYTTFGLRGVVALTDRLTARGTLAWRHAFGDITPLAKLAFHSGGPEFALAGSPIARDALVTEAGLDFAIAPNASLGVAWTSQFAEASRDNTLKGNLRWSF